MNIHAVYNIFFGYFRTKRIKKLYDVFNITADTNIVDVGGSLYWWELATKLGLDVPHVTIVNLYKGPEMLPANIKWIVGDGTALPFDDNSFDLVFCNSVIEHLGTWEGQKHFADEIVRVSKKYYVQTPNKSFFVEPHLITPFIHWMPTTLQLKLLRYFTIWGLMTKPSAEKCQEFIDEIRLLTRNEMSLLFPNADIVSESFLGFCKSIIAIKK